ncbi:MAG TPA: type II secretion system F family protein [Patescibacteria group bacterium]|nr:type II secretion system F family protein [Patescibacteria group bacterium]
MAVYNYKAINLRGRKVAGQLNANNELELHQRLKQGGMELITASEVKAGKKFWAVLGGGIKTRDLIHVCLHLQQLIGAGVSLIEGLADVRDSVEQRRLRDVMAEVHQDVTEGKSLSEAFNRHPRIFGTVFQSLLAAGEASGNLTESFTQLVKHLKWTEAVSAKIKKATRYPLIMLFMMFALFTFMMLFVVPQVVEFLVNSGQELPTITKSLIATSDFMQNYWWAVAGTPFVIFFSMRMMIRMSSDFAYRVDYAILRLPVFGMLIRKIALSRFSHFFATMFQSGVPILECLETAQKVVSNRCLSQSLGAVRNDVQDGNPLSAGLKDTGEFPNLVIRMVKIGEDSGRLGEILENVTEFYDKDVDESVDALVTMIEPALTAFAGLMMVWIVAGVMGPIYNSFSKLG